MIPCHLGFEMKHREHELARSLERRQSWRLSARHFVAPDAATSDVPVATPVVHAPQSTPKSPGGKPRAA